MFLCPLDHGGAGCGCSVSPGWPAGSPSLGWNACCDGLTSELLLSRGRGALPYARPDAPSYLDLILYSYKIFLVLSAIYFT